MNPGPGSVSVIGMGYVGLCTSAVFASKGIRTVGIDIDEKRIAQIQQGQAHIGEAASIRVITLLLKNGARVIASDPLAIPNAWKQLGENVKFTEDERSALNGADCCIVMTEWSQFEKLQRKTTWHS